MRSTPISDSPRPADQRRLVVAVAVAVAIVAVGAALALAVNRNDIMALYRHRGIRPGAPPYTDRFLEYPVVIGGLAWLMSFAARTAGLTLALYCVLAAVLLVVVQGFLDRRGELGRRWFAVVPALVFYGVHNYDLIAASTSVIGVVVFEQGSFAAAGVLLAVATWTKLYAAAIVFGFLVLLWRDQRRPEAARLLAAFALGSLVLNLPVVIAAPQGWMETFRFHVKRTPSWGSLWFYAVHNLHRALIFSPSTTVRVVNALGALAIVSAMALMTVWIWRNGPRPAAVACVAAIGFVVSNKVFSPQYDLWLLPLMILAGTPPVLVQRFAVIDAAVYADVFLVPLFWRHGAGGRPLVMFVLVVARTYTLVRVLVGMRATARRQRLAPAAV